MINGINFYRNQKLYNIISIFIIFLFLTSCNCDEKKDIKKPILVDKKASEKTIALHNRLLEISKKGFAIGHQDDTSYGLGNYLQTEDREKAHRVAKKLRSGCVYINGNAADAGTPFGGYQQSGNGREGGKWGIEDFCEIKHITGWTL